MRTPRHGATIAFLAFISVLMAYGIDVALPAYDQLDIEFDLDARGLSPALIGTPYFVGTAVGQLICGVLADRYGRRSILVAGLIVYALGAIASAWSSTLGVLLVVRFIWGLGASAPSVLRFAIARDLYEGDRLAQVVASFTAVFLIGPIVVPFFGEAILAVGSWRWIFIVGSVLAMIAIAWTVGFGETMAPEHRRPIQVAPFVDALNAVVRTPVTRWSIVALTLFTAQFFTWLGSAQPIFANVYDRASMFTMFFALSGAGMAVALVVNNRLIERFGLSKMTRGAAVTHVVVSVVGLGGALATSGVPGIWVFFAWALLTNTMTMLIGPMAASIAMEPMPDKAGTASALLGLSQLGLGGLLAAIVDAQIETTVTPMVFGAVCFGIPGVAAVYLATRTQPAAPASVA